MNGVPGLFLKILNYSPSTFTNLKILHKNLNLILFLKKRKSKPWPNSWHLTMPFLFRCACLPVCHNLYCFLYLTVLPTCLTLIAFTFRTLVLHDQQFQKWNPAALVQKVGGWEGDPTDRMIYQKPRGKSFKK